MAYAGVQMFMEKLKQLINCNNNPLINNPAITCERPQFQLLYEELGSMIQTLFIDEHEDLHDLEKVDDLKKRFIRAAEEAQYIVDLFLSAVHITSDGHFTISEDSIPSLNYLDDVRRSFKSVEVELTNKRIESMMVDSSRRPETTQNQSASGQNSFTRNLLGSKKLLGEIIVGLDGDASLIRDKLVEDQKKRDVVSIVGMGGLGKTTLATKVYNDCYVMHHFHVRAWVTVSQTYDKRAVLTQILESIQGHLDLEEVVDYRLREMVHKHLMGQRYLIVLDDIWNIEAWDNMNVFFPHDNTGSRILLTSRLTEVAKHANPDGLIHHLGCMNEDKSWELLCQNLFHGNECPEWSIKPGMQIVKNCQGLPLAVVVIAGVLAKEAWSKKFWLEIVERTSSYIVGDQNGCLETLALSYNHLPLHLRECLLYLGGFPEDYKFQVRRMVWLWVAEGFIQQDGNRSLEDIAEGYLMDLIHRNLVIVAHTSKFDGSVKACKVHDLVRELCMRKAKEEKFILKIERPCILSSQFSDVITPPYKPDRMFIDNAIDTGGFHYQSAQYLRTILCFPKFVDLWDFVPKGLSSFVLLRVLDLQKYELKKVPKHIKLLVHLRYLAIWISSKAGFPPSICNLWNLQTLIYITGNDRTVLPRNISDLVNLRHLWAGYKNLKKLLVLPSIEKPMTLQTISDVLLGDGVDNFQKCFPNVKELACAAYLDEEGDFKSLSYLETLQLTGLHRRRNSTVHDSPKREPKNHITFPETLKTLALFLCRLPWSDMSIIHLLPNLQVLKLRYHAFEGHCWNTDEQEFRQLRFLRLEVLNIRQWEACSLSFPCLRQLEVFSCEDLEEIPLEIADIPTLELIKIKKCKPSVGESVNRIQEEQKDLGNYDLKIDISDNYIFSLKELQPTKYST